jgi:hypothetical protein
VLKEPLVLRAHGIELVGHLSDPGAERSDGIGGGVRIGGRGLGDGLHHGGGGGGIGSSAALEPYCHRHEEHHPGKEEGDGIGTGFHQRHLPQKPSDSTKG